MVSNVNNCKSHYHKIAYNRFHGEPYRRKFLNHFSRNISKMINDNRRYSATWGLHFLCNSRNKAFVLKSYYCNGKGVGTIDVYDVVFLPYAAIKYLLWKHGVILCLKLILTTRKNNTRSQYTTRVGQPYRKLMTKLEELKINRIQPQI